MGPAGRGPVRLPDVVRLKTLAKLLKMTPSSLANHLPSAHKSGGRITCVFGGAPHLFLNLAQVVVPFTDAKRIAQELRGREVKPFFFDPPPPMLHTVQSVGSEERTPVVALLGHFDHGKTSLLDALSRAPGDVPTLEPQGITQEIRTRRVDLRRSRRFAATAIGIDAPYNQRAMVDSVPETTEGSGDEEGSSEYVTFIDTPGQDIFYRLRANGSLGADVALLVVDASAGALVSGYSFPEEAEEEGEAGGGGKLTLNAPQMAEAIGCAEELRIPVIVALNKADLVDYDEGRLTAVEAELRDFVILSEINKAPVVAVSARSRWGIPRLIEKITKQIEPFRNIKTLAAQQDSEFKEHRERETNQKVQVEDGAEEVRKSMEQYRPDAVGVTLDFGSRRKDGKFLHVLLQRGELHPGDHFLCGHVRGRVRALKRMADDHLDPHVVDDDDDDASGGCGGVETEAGKEIGNPVLAMKVETYAKREAKDKKKKKKKQSKKKTRGDAVESEKMALHELGAGEAALVICSFQTESDSERKARRSSRTGSGSGGGGGGGVVRFSPVGEPFFVFRQNPSIASELQDVRLARQQLQDAALRGEALHLEDNELDADDGNEDTKSDRHGSEFENEMDKIEEESTDESEDSGPYEYDFEMYEEKLCPVIVKADSANALVTILDALSDDLAEEDIDASLRPEVVMAQVGNVTKNDIELSLAAWTELAPRASNEKAAVHAFRVSTENKHVTALARQKGVNIRFFDTLQALLDDIRSRALYMSYRSERIRK